MMVLRVRGLAGGEWLSEMKFDSYRALAKAGSKVRLLSRNRTLFNYNYQVLMIPSNS
jgi:ATP-dependent DNA ligase